MAHYSIETVNRDGRTVRYGATGSRAEAEAQAAVARTLSTDNPVGVAITTSDGDREPDITKWEIWG